MKAPTKPTAQPPPSSRGADEPSSGRARKDVNYVPAVLDDSGDALTPMRMPNVSTLLPAASTPTSPVEWQPQPLPTGPMEPISPPPAPPPPPPPSQRHFAPPPSVSPISAPVPHATSSARVRRSAPMEPAPYSSPYPSQHGPASQQHITGPQLPVPMHPNPVTASGSALPRETSAEEGMPLGYVVASAFFLAIALVGFGLYLAFEVISL